MLKLMIIARHFPPSGRVSVLRPLKLANQFAALGLQATVLTAEPSCMGSRRDTSLMVEAGRLDVVRARCGNLLDHCQEWGLRKGLFDRLTHLSGLVAAQLAKRVWPDYGQYEWLRAAVPAGVEAVRERGIDLIFATAPPYETLELARRIALETGVPFVADFRDLPRDWHCASMAFTAMDEILQAAAAITYVSPPQGPSLLAAFPKLAQDRMRFVPNWFDERERAGLELCAPAVSGPLRLIHGGSLYGGSRDARGLLQAIARFNQAAPARRLHFDQYSLGDARFLLAHARENGCEHDVSIHPAVPRRILLETCQASDVLLLLVGHDSGNTQHADAIPAKLFDYLLCDRPVLVLGPANCTAGQIVVNCKRGIHVSDRDPEAILSALHGLVQAPEQVGLDLSREAVAAYSAKEVCGGLIDFFEQLKAARARDTGQ